jgi:rhamnosyltransferase
MDGGVMLKSASAGTVGIVIPVLNGGAELRRLLPILRAEAGSPEVLVVDSASTDDTVAVVEEFPGVHLHRLPPGVFNHGTTREFARRRLGTQVVVMLTQDVVPEAGFLAPLVAPILSREVVVTYARQLPRPGSDVFESAPRDFNYPAAGNVRSLDNVRELGVYTFFCSDSCAAYSNEALDRIGGFKRTLTNEDYFAVAALLREGFRIRYVSDSCVTHSHRYTLRQEFERYFDTGYVRAENPWVNDLAGAAEARGTRFAAYLLKKLFVRAPWLIPYALLQTAVKWLGFRIGFLAQRLRLSAETCRYISSQKYYWTQLSQASAVSED